MIVDSSSSSAIGNDKNDDATIDQTMRKKHVQAMEEYVKQNMEKEADSNKSSAANNDQQEEIEFRKNAQDLLYEELMNDAVKRF